MNEINDNDKLMAALCYPIAIPMSIIVLVSESMKTRPFQKYHAVQALVLWAVACIPVAIISCLTLGIGLVIAWLVSLWPAYKAYKGESFEIPVISNFIKKQGWV